MSETPAAKSLFVLITLYPACIEMLPNQILPGYPVSTSQSEWKFPFQLSFDFLFIRRLKVFELFDAWLTYYLIHIFCHMFSDLNIAEKYMCSG